MCHNCGIKSCSGCKNKCESKKCCGHSHSHHHHGHEHSHEIDGLTIKGKDVLFCKQMSDVDKKCFEKYGFSNGMDYDTITMKFVTIINQLEGKLKEVLEKQRLIDDNATNGIKFYYIASGGTLPVESATVTLRKYDYCLETSTGNASGTILKTYVYDGLIWKLV
jgi:hypothetical protein